MSEYRVSDYTFLGLVNHGKPISSVKTTLDYLVALVESIEHPVTEPREASGIIDLVFDGEDQHRDASEVLSWQEGALPVGYLPQTPVMLTTAWSPISALLKRQFQPIILRRTPDAWAFATGVWAPQTITDAKPLSEATTAEELFWAIMSEAFRRARERNQLVSVMADTGWSYPPEDDALDDWDSKQIAEADKILWQRTPRSRRISGP